MESTQSNGNMKAQKVKASNENVSPLQMDDQIGRYLQSVTTSPRLQPFAENIDATSPLARYFFDGSPLSGEVVTASDAFTSSTFGSSKYSSAKSQQYSGSNSGSSSSLGPRSRLSLSPLSSVENLDMAQLRSSPMYGTPVKVNEEVLVMDDILVRSTPGRKNGKPSSSSSGRNSASSSSSSSSPPWVNSGSQFAHGKDQMHPTRPTMKSGNEAQMRNSPLSSGSGSGSSSGVYGSNSHTVYQRHAAAEPVVTTTSQPARPAKLVPRRTLLAPVNTNPNTSREWSPLDDGIKVVFLDASDRAPSREQVDSSISRLLQVLHQGRTDNRRLPVFVTLGVGHDPMIDKKPPQ